MLEPLLTLLNSRITSRFRQKFLVQKLRNRTISSTIMKPFFSKSIFYSLNPYLFSCSQLNLPFRFCAQFWQLSQYLRANSSMDWLESLTEKNGLCSSGVTSNYLWMSGNEREMPFLSRAYLIRFYLSLIPVELNTTFALRRFSSSSTCFFNISMSLLLSAFEVSTSACGRSALGTSRLVSFLRFDSLYSVYNLQECLMPTDAGGFYTSCVFSLKELALPYNLSFFSSNIAEGSWAFAQNDNLLGSQQSFQVGKFISSFFFSCSLFFILSSIFLISSSMFLFLSGKPSFLRSYGRQEFFILTVLSGAGLAEYLLIFSQMGGSVLLLALPGTQYLLTASQFVSTQTLLFVNSGLQCFQGASGLGMASFFGGRSSFDLSNCFPWVFSLRQLRIWQIFIFILSIEPTLSYLTCLDGIQIDLEGIVTSSAIPLPPNLGMSLDQSTLLTILYCIEGFLDNQAEGFSRRLDGQTIIDLDTKADPYFYVLSLFLKVLQLEVLREISLRALDSQGSVVSFSLIPYFFLIS